MLRLLGTEALAPGQEGWIQLELRTPVVAVRGDRYILRRPSPAETLGGGVIIDPQPKERHKRFEGEVLQSLASLSRGTPAEVLLEAALALHAASLKDVILRSGLEAAAAQQGAQELLKDKKLLWLEEPGAAALMESRLVIAEPHWQELRERAGRVVSSYHGKFPLRAGMPREELKSRLNLTPRVFNALVARLVADGDLNESSASVAKPEHAIRLDSQQQTRAGSLLRKFTQNPYAPPTMKECLAEAGEELVNALVELEELVPVSSDVVFLKPDYDEMVRRVGASLKETGQITLAEVRDMFGTSRKYAQALLEHLDATGVTRRDGDIRRLK
jgi:selenocysteine-specific elongation factor